MRPPRTFVAAATHEAAVDWCRANGVRPFASTTLVVTRSSLLRGHVIREGDRIVVLPGTSEPVVEGLFIAGATLAGSWRDHVRAIWDSYVGGPLVDVTIQEGGEDR